MGSDAFRTSSFVHRGHTLVFDTYGEGERLLVYMHGLLLDAELNRGIAAALAQHGNRVVLIDLLGHGRSDKPTHASEYRIDSYATQVFALLDELGVERAVLGGLSLGANVSLFAASQRPDRVRALVLEMPVLEWTVPAAALAFVPILLAAHYAPPVLRVTSSAVRRIPPFNDAERLARQLPNAELVKARSPFELRLRPQRLTDRVVQLREVWQHDAAHHDRPPDDVT